MLRLKMIISVLLFLTISICIHPVNTLIAGTCDEMESSGSSSTSTGDHVYSENWNAAPELDPSIPEEIAPDSSIPLTVSGGCAPYTWLVSGQGFTLDEPDTTGSTNTLIADGTSCGTATVTVVGCNGTTVVGQVRGTAGHWEYNTECSLYFSYYTIETIIGGEYSKTWYWCPNNSGSCPSGINPPSVNISYWIPSGGYCYYTEGCDPYCDLIPCALVTGNWVCN